MVSIYTDASVSSGVAIATCMLLSDKAFIGFDTNTYNEVAASQIGEILAIRDGLRLYSKSGLSDEDVTLYTDHEYAVKLIADGDSSKLTDASDLLEEILEYVRKYNVCVKHITAHQMQHNPNKIVDQMSRHKLRRELRRK